MRKFGLCFIFIAVVGIHAVHGDGFVLKHVDFPSVVPGNKSGGGWVVPTAFPKTFSDLSRDDRMAVKAAGYEPFKDMKAYRDIVVEGEEQFIERQLALLMSQRDIDARTMSDAAYCEKYPLDDARCKTPPSVAACIVSWGAICNGVSPNSPTPNGSNVPNASSTNPPASATPSTPPTSTTPSTQIPPRAPSGNNTFAGQTIGGGAVVVNNRTTGGSCYPAARSGWFRNTVLTSGQYEQVSPAFEKALITLFRKEGGCGTIPNDPCGYTCYGLGSGPKCMNMDVSKLTRKDAETVYYDRFWNKYHFERLPDVISGELFLSAAGAGVCTSIQQFREFLGLNKNCKIDDELVAAAKNYNGDILNDWLDVRKQFLINVSQRRYANSVLTGWLNGVEFRRENGCHVVPNEPLYR